MRAPIFKMLCVLPLFALMAPTSGGLPSRPTFQAVTVNGTATAATANVTGTATAGTLAATTANVSGTATAGTLNVTGNASVTGTSTVTGKAIFGAAQSSIGGVLFLPPVNSQISVTPFGAGGVVQSGVQWFQDNNLYLDSAQTGTPTGGSVYVRGLGTAVLAKFDATGSQIGVPTGGAKGAGTLNAGAFYQNGVQVPKFAYAQCTAAGGFVGTAQGLNVTACTRNSLGSYSVTLSAGYTGLTPICSTTANNSTFFIASAVTTLTNVAVSSWTAAGAAADSTFSISCVGT